MSIIVDASIVFAFQFPDETSATADRVFEMLLNRDGVVPVHWHAEIANGFAMAVRRNRMTREFRTGALSSLASLRFIVDEASRLHGDCRRAHEAGVDPGVGGGRAQGRAVHVVAGDDRRLGARGSGGTGLASARGSSRAGGSATWSCWTTVTFISLRAGRTLNWTSAIARIC